MFFIGQNVEHVHKTNSFLEHLKFIGLTLVNIYCLEFISHYIKEILYINKTQRKQNVRDTVIVSDIDIENS